MAMTFIRAALAFVACTSVSSPAYAYLDPATGSIIVQGFIGVVASWIMYSKLFAAKAKSFVSRLFKGEKTQRPE